MSRDPAGGPDGSTSDAPPQPGPLAEEHDQVVVRHGDLEIEENMDAQRRLWRVQRVCRVLAVLLLLVALAGGLGGGFLAQGRIAIGGHALEYERIGYRDMRHVYRVTVAASAVQAGKARVWVGRDTLTRMTLTRVVPTPSRSIASGDRVVFEFDAEAASGPIEILLTAQPAQAGMHAARIGIEGGPTFDVSQMLLP